MNKSQKDWFQYGLAAIVVILAFVLIFMVAFRGLPSNDTTFTNLFFAVVMGVMNALMLVLGYFFGSSKGSSEKNEMLSKSGVQQ